MQVESTKKFPPTLVESRLRRFAIKRLSGVWAEKVADLFILSGLLRAALLKGWQGPCIFSLSCLPDQTFSHAFLSGYPGPEPSLIFTTSLKFDNTSSFYVGKQRAKAFSNLMGSLVRISHRRIAQNRFRSFAKNPSQVWRSAMR